MENELWGQGAEKATEAPNGFLEYGGSRRFLFLPTVNGILPQCVHIMENLLLRRASAKYGILGRPPLVKSIRHPSGKHLNGS